MKRMLHFFRRTTLCCILILPAILSAHDESEESFVDLHLFPSEEIGRDGDLIKQFLLFSASEKISDPDFNLSYQSGGMTTIFGPDAMLSIYAESVQKSLEEIQEGALSDEAFEELKGKFIQKLEQTPHEKSLAEEIQLEMLSDFFSSQEISKEIQSFYQLRLTAEDQVHISKMVKNLGELSWFRLLKKKHEMEKLGDQILAVHPLRFIGYILSTPSLKKQLPKICHEYLKRKSFFEGHGRRIGFNKRMSQEDANHHLTPYIAGFAHQVGVSEASLLDFFNRKDWEGLVRYLL